MAAELTPSGVLAARAMLSRGQQVAVLGGGGVSYAPDVNQSTLVSEVQAPGAPMKPAERFGNCDTLGAGLSALNCALSFFQ